MRFAVNATALIFSLVWPTIPHAQDWDHRGPTDRTEFGSNGRDHDREPSASHPAVSPPPHDDQPYPARYGRWAPGQTLSPDAHAVVLTDYERYHLRRPPHGYVWLFCDGDYILAATASGRIFDVVPAGGD